MLLSVGLWFRKFLFLENRREKKVSFDVFRSKLWHVYRCKTASWTVWLSIIWLIVFESFTQKKKSLPVFHMLNKFVVGHIPGKPQGGRHGMVFGQISSSTIGNSPQKLLVPGQSEHLHTIFYSFSVDILFASSFFISFSFTFLGIRWNLDLWNVLFRICVCCWISAEMREKLEFFLFVFHHFVS